MSWYFKCTNVINNLRDVLNKQEHLIKASFDSLQGFQELAAADLLASNKSGQAKF